MRNVSIFGVLHHDDGSMTVKYVDYRDEIITDRNEITAISREFARQKQERANRPPSFPNLNA